MDNLEDSENNAKISDSAYSNSCSNSQSRRSHSSKSTHSGSNSSGSSGYGGKPSTSGSSNTLGQPPKKDKESKKKKLPQTETIVPDAKVEIDTRPPEPTAVFVAPKEEPSAAVQTASSSHALSENGVENMDISSSEKNSAKNEDGFSCVISMHDGVVMYTTSSITITLGFPKEMWIGRSFIDFVHPKDRSTFASQITNGLAVPKNVNGTQEKAQSPANSVSTMVCRIRRYRGLTTGFGVKDKILSFMPFLLKLTFKNISDEEGKVIYLVIQATPFFSAFKMPNEVVAKAIPFVLRHAANGIIEYIDPESVPYLGFLPQDLAEKDALQLYHPADLCYLRQVYETIVKEGAVPRCRPYRMVTQNGHYIKLETEWSSFINPWSKKLEFVIGKHHIIEGPENPDVFQSPENEVKYSDEENNKAKMLRESIIRIMNEVLTKPAELAKLQMSKRCQDLASFMESLMEEQPKTDDELRLEIQDPDHSYYEQDSVMLGGISPHHDYNDSKSSTETPLSYNQLNYNDTLQRYFDSHQPYSYEDYNTATGENILGLKEPRPILNTGSSHCLSPMAQTSGDSAEFTSSCESNGKAACSISPKAPLGDYEALHLTESLLTKHNSEMEKELMKIHRGTRSSSKGDREKASNATRQKKKEHLARCNASFQPTSACATPTNQKKHGVKRASRHTHDTVANKYHCTSSRQALRHQKPLSTSAAVTQPSSTITTTVAPNQWPTNAIGNTNRVILGVGVPQQMPIMSPVAAMPGLYPMYYAPSIAQLLPSSSQHKPSIPISTQFQTPQMPYMMYGQPMYGSPIIYSPVNQQMPMQQMPMQQAPMQQTFLAQSMQYTSTMNPLGLTHRNYEEACKPGLPIVPGKLSTTQGENKRLKSQGTSTKTDIGSADSCSSTKALNRDSAPRSHSGSGGLISSDLRSSNSLKSTEAVPDTPPANEGKTNRVGSNNEEIPDKTDGESSYSSFYSSFFKTESGSADDSGDAKKAESSRSLRAMTRMNTSGTYLEPRQTRKVAKRKMEPPWMEQVCVTSELIYKYQVLTKTMDEVLLADKEKMATLQQPSLVNEQLGQLYLDLQLEGVAARLTLEEGVTSSSSSSEESTTKTPEAPRRKREYSKLVMIYEEDAPLPSPGEVEREEAACSSAS